MKQCYYDVLGLEQRASFGEIKKAYRELALRCHPDKNPHNLEEAQRQFVLLQEAYETLSDPDERAWYDGHRSQILHGATLDGEEGLDASAARINIYSWFRKDCFNGFSESVDGKGGKDCFYTVYSRVFKLIVEEEQRNTVDARHSDYRAVADAPVFGTSSSSLKEVNMFYKFWLQFNSQRSYAFGDRWNLSEAPNRATRRQMELENKASRANCRKEFNSAVRALAAWLKKRDPRLLAATVEKTAEVQQRNREAEAAREAAAAERAQQRAIAKELERQRWELLDKAKEEARLQGQQAFVADSDTASSCSSAENRTSGPTKQKQTVPEVCTSYICEACRRSFRSEAQFRSHERSKKHIRAVEDLLRVWENEEEASIQLDHCDIVSTKEGQKATEDEPSSDTTTKSEATLDALNHDAVVGGRCQTQPFTGPSSPRPADFAMPHQSLDRHQEESGPECTDSSVTTPSDVDTEEDEEDSDEEDSDEEDSDEEDSDEEDSDEEDSDKKDSDEEDSDEEHSDEDALFDAMHRMRLSRHGRQEDVDDDSASSSDTPDSRHDTQRERNAETHDVHTNGQVQATCAAPTSQPSRRQLRRTARKAKSSASASRFVCEICRDEFATKNKLFQHIRSTGHAALKPVADRTVSSHRRK